METNRTQTSVKDNIATETQIDGLQLQLARARSRGNRLHFW